MKKILGISLVAMMAVTAANADIASKAFVEQRDTATLTSAEGYTDTKIGALGNIPNTETPYANVKAYVDDKVQAAESAASGGIADLDVAEIKEAGKVVTAISETDGKVSATLGKITNAEIDAAAGIEGTKLATGVQTSLGYADDWNTTKTTSSVTTADLTKLHGVTADVTELNYVDGVTSSIQTQLDAKQATANMITGTNTTGENAIDQTAIDKYPSMATAKAIADASAANAVNSSVSIASATNGVSASVSNGAITMAGTDATTSAKGVMQVGTDLAVANGVVSVDKSTTVASADTKPVSSGAVYTALHNFAGAPVANDTDGVYALTAVVTDGVATYHWELIERGTQGD